MGQDRSYFPRRSERALGLRNRAIINAATLISMWAVLRTYALVADDNPTQQNVDQTFGAVLAKPAVAPPSQIRFVTRDATAMYQRRHVPLKFTNFKRRYEPAVPLADHSDALSVAATSWLRPASGDHAHFAIDQAYPEFSIQPDHPTRAGLDISVSGWSIVRGSARQTSLATNGQLGGSQIGIRFAAKLPYVGADVYGRISAPIEGRGKEAALGLSLRPAKHIPVEVLIERRIAIDRQGRNSFALLAAGGIDDRKIGGIALLSGYGQIGVVGVKARDKFADGAIRFEHPLTNARRAQIRIGTGLWGAAQRDVARLDAGPSVALIQKIGSGRLRISAEYRWRVAGRAEPGSGPAVSVGFGL